MDIVYSEHYSSEYWQGTKKYRGVDGMEHAYTGPSLTWDGFDLVADALCRVWKPKAGDTMLDVGCGGGDFARRMMRRGLDAYGCDVSEYALDNVVPEMRDRVAYCDITQAPKVLPCRHTMDHLPAKYDFVTSLDLMEHLYPEDLDATFDWICSKTQRKLFLLVATVDTDKQEFIHVKGTPIPLEWEATAVSGHVHVRHFEWWVKYFSKRGMKIDWPRMYLFQRERERDHGWHNTGGWSHGTTFFLEKP